MTKNSVPHAHVDGEGDDNMLGSAGWYIQQKLPKR